ncbi:uncharacterized protein LOC143041239 [Oratosquilla oratoria]|uniref:uncharacterized protein LOC143041239 n=1 Tax=Oratosquilla oratoria TaxID=337810 RepID=UPI003F75C640
MEVDAEKLIVLVEARPSIYNYTLKDHHNKEIINMFWDEIATEVGSTSEKCKAKWNSIRTSYSRFLRDEKQPSGSGASKKKKWYLAESLAFLRDYMGKHRNLGSNSNVVDENEAEQNADVSDFSEEADGIAIPAEQSSPCPDNFAQPPPKKKTKGKTSMITDVAGPMIEFLKSRTSVAKTEMTQSHNSKFLESLVPDMDKLTPRRQRQFKEKALTTLNRFLDEQEEEAVWLSRDPQCTTTLAPSPQYVNSPSPQQLINSPSPQHLINTGIESVQQPVLSTPHFSQQNCQDNTTWNNL